MDSTSLAIKLCLLSSLVTEIADQIISYHIDNKENNFSFILNEIKPVTFQQLTSLFKSGSEFKTTTTSSPELSSIASPSLLNIPTSSSLFS